MNSSNARQRAQEALSHARRATDPEMQRQWRELAEAWARIAEEEPQPERAMSKPRIVIRNSD
jgi:hypothetical protein